MSVVSDKLLTLAENFEALSTGLLDKTAKKQKLDPKAEVRNRGTVCVPASSAKDKQDHFPINSEAQARNALARVHQYNKVPPWYSGSLKGLQDLVSRKVHSKYPSIGKEKKSFNVSGSLLEKYGQSFLPAVKKYQLGMPNVESRGADLLTDLMETLKINAFHVWEDSDQTEKDQRVKDILLQQAEVLGKVHPEMEALDQALNNIEGSAAIVVSSVSNKLLKKYASVEAMTKLLESYESTSAFLRDLAQCQFTIGGTDPNDTTDESYETTKKLHDMILELAARMEPIEQTMW